MTQSSNSNLKKALDLYKSDNTARYLLMGEMRDVLNKHFGFHISTSVRKPEILAEFNNLLSVETYPVIQAEVTRFGLTLKEIASLLECSQYKAKKLISGGEIKKIGEFRCDTGIYIFFYDFMDVIRLMPQGLERKYAVTHTIENTEQIIKVFDTKDDAIAYGDAVAHDYKDGTVACIQALFDFSTNKMSASRRIFHVWA